MRSQRDSLEKNPGRFGKLKQEVPPGQTAREALSRKQNQCIGDGAWMGSEQWVLVAPAPGSVPVHLADILLPGFQVLCRTEISTAL